jgi:hypothetical protein
VLEATANVRTVDVILPLALSGDEEAIRDAVCAQLGLPKHRLTGLRVRKHSLDARKREIKVQLRLEVGIDEPLAPEEPPAFLIWPRRNSVVAAPKSPSNKVSSSFE